MSLRPARGYPISRRASTNHIGNIVAETQRPTPGSLFARKHRPPSIWVRMSAAALLRKNGEGLGPPSGIVLCQRVGVNAPRRDRPNVKKRFKGNRQQSCRNSV